MCALRELATLRQRSLHASYVCGMTLANKYLEFRMVGELKFDAVTTAAGTRLRGTYKIHLTNVGKSVRQVRPFLQPASKSI